MHQCSIKFVEEEVYLPRHRFVKARGHPPQTLQKYRIAFATSHKAPEQIHKLLFLRYFFAADSVPFSPLPFYMYLYVHSMTILLDY